MTTPPLQKLLFVLIFFTAVSGQADEMKSSPDVAAAVMPYLAQKYAMPHPFQLAMLEAPLSETERASLTVQLAAVPGFAFIDIMASDDTETVRFDINPSDLHQIDINHDQQLDIVYESFLGMNRGNHLKILLGDDSSEQVIIEIAGRILSVNNNGFLVHQQPCCDGFFHTFSVYKHAPVIEPQARHIVFQSNLDNVQKIETLTHDVEEMELKKGSLIYYLGSRAIHLERQEPPILDDDTGAGFFPFAAVNEPAKVVVFDVARRSGGRHWSLAATGLESLSTFPQLKRAGESVTNGHVWVYGWVESSDLAPLDWQ